MQLSSSTSKSRDPVKEKKASNVKMKINETRDKVKNSLEENTPWTVSVEQEACSKAVYYSYTVLDGPD